MTTALHFDREPIETAVLFGLVDSKGGKPLTKEEYIIHVIQHTENFPDTGEISLESAALAVEAMYKHKSIPVFTPEEYAEIWNRVVHDKTIMHIE